MGFFADSINSLTLWISSALYGGYVAANFLKWIWWRFNGWGYFWGMLAGLIIASFQFILDKNKENFTEGSFWFELAQIPAIYLFPIIFTFSLIGSFLGTFLTKPTDMSTLKSFYHNVRPWGLWKPVYTELKNEDRNFEKNNEFLLDMFNCLVGIIWQSAMILIPIFLVFRDYPKTIWVTVIFVITSLILKFTWLDRVRKISDIEENKIIV